MTFVVNQNCINCKYGDCIEVCPVECFYEGPNMLVINPDECIDCALCEPECPVDAIVADDDLSEDQQELLEINAKYSALWPNITEKCEPPADADDWKDRKDKLQFLDPGDKAE